VRAVADVGGPENIDPRIRVPTGLRSKKSTALPNRLPARIVILHRVRVSDEIPQSGQRDKDRMRGPRSAVAPSEGAERTPWSNAPAQHAAGDDPRGIYPASKCYDIALQSGKLGETVRA
jgi:hypothetical protein